MKKIIIYLAVVFLCTSSFAQITLSKEFNVYSLTTVSNDCQIPFDYYYMATNKNTLEIYDESFSLIKKINGLPNYSYVYGVYKNVYTNSNKFEFILLTANGYCLYNEDKEKIYDFEGFMINTLCKDKLITYKNNVTDSTLYTYRIYQLEGEYIKPNLKGDKGEEGQSAYEIAVKNGYSGTEQQWIASLKGEPGEKGDQGEPGVCKCDNTQGITSNNKSINSAYPNPANNVFTIEYNINRQEVLDIYNSQGRLFEKHQLSPSDNYIQLDISKYAAGTYIYQFGNNSGKFIVK